MNNKPWCENYPLGLLCSQLRLVNCCSIPLMYTRYIFNKHGHTLLSVFLLLSTVFIVIITYLIIWFHRFSSDMVNSGVERTNIIYGGLDLKATRVVYVHGSIDPWHALGVTSTRLTESPAIFINGISSYFPKFEVQSSYSFMLENTTNAGCKVCLL